MNRLSLVALLVGSLALAIALNTNTTTSPAPQPRVTAATTTTHASPVTQGAGTGQGHDGGHSEGYTCTSASSCAVLAAALSGPTAAPQTHAPRHRSTQPRAHTSTQRRASGPSQGELVYHGPTQCFEDGHCRHDGDRMLSHQQVTGIIAGMCQEQGPSGPACRVLASR